MSKDLGIGDCGYGRVYSDYENGQLREDGAVFSVSQEHGLVAAPLRMGDRVRILPNHACLTAACFDEYCVVVGGKIVDRWPISRAR